VAPVEQYANNSIEADHNYDLALDSRPATRRAAAFTELARAI
jgi:hypothetical protein